jgi:hypothetical protein
MMMMMMTFQIVYILLLKRVEIGIMYRVLWFHTHCEQQCMCVHVVHIYVCLQHTVSNTTTLSLLYCLIGS